MPAPELIPHGDSIGKGDGRAMAYKGGPVSVNSSLDEHHGESGPTHEHKDKGIGRV
jgi:hypothetical protein